VSSALTLLRLLDRRPGLSLDLLVYTPRELRQLYLFGSPFIEEVMDTGRVLYMRKASLEVVARR